MPTSKEQETIKRAKDVQDRVIRRVATQKDVAWLTSTVLNMCQANTINRKYLHELEIENFTLKIELSEAQAERSAFNDL